ncbi:hypothetical protein B5X24_HaOG213383 [Helicoverpa armigera]|uniref:Sushi domain-containing protein n=1 Tax=Helicoverpa armigera TaxID=29058 RepID=A0A2W1BIE4_HELAM|nr:hypothetical protein B5X24_HaOG213383 [Helicoverpa armigera]
MTAPAVAISPALSSVVRHIASNQSCSENQFKCLDGLCISSVRVCDASLDCSDGSDEDLCPSISTNGTTGDGLGRYRRQSACRKLEWQCKDGGCISSDEKCDGTRNCLDGSDETHALCRKMLCLPHLFRCTYGACVDGTAPCDKKTDCADSSDELIPKCRGAFDLNRKEFVCVDGSRTIPPGDLCDGVVNCQDGSDENVSACGEQRCPGNLFQCAYGACVDGNSDCNGIPDCADGSDEADDLCNRATPRPLSIPPVLPSVPTRINTGDYKSGKCELPQYPAHGKYQVINAMDARPGDRLHYVRLVIQCDEGYGGIQKPEVFCTDGSWSIKRLPDCHRLCILNKHPSVKYSCHVTSNGIQGKRECNESEPTGTKVESICNEPIYHSAYPLPMMEYCGRRTPAVDVLVAGGQPALRGQLPWHVAIYRKPTKSQNFYRQICGGSLISNSIVLTDVMDVITLLKETDPDDVPTFVVKDLNKLPPVTFDHVDVTSLLKDIVFLKASLADVQKKLDASQNTVADLRSELNELRKSVTVTGPPVGASNVNMRRGAMCRVQVSRQQFCRHRRCHCRKMLSRHSARLVRPAAPLPSLRVLH